jgi:hypothetical protein
MSELRIMEYQGKYRIESGRQDGDKWWADRIRKKVWNKETRAFEIEDKDRNLSIPLGDLESAKAILAGLELMLRTEKEQPAQADVPF